MGTGKRLEPEIDLITPPSKASVYHREGYGKIEFSSIGIEYITPLTKENIFDYYDHELTKNGWYYLSQEHLPDDNFYVKNYCKNKDTASIYYYDYGNDYNYELVLESGSLSECNFTPIGGSISILDALSCTGCTGSWLVILIIGIIRYRKNINKNEPKISEKLTYILCFIFNFLAMIYSILIIGMHLLQ